MTLRYEAERQWTETPHSWASLTIHSFSLIAKNKLKTTFKNYFRPTKVFSHPFNILLDLDSKVAAFDCLFMFGCVGSGFSPLN